jgi:lipopolysaccharide export system protein LptC
MDIAADRISARQAPPDPYLRAKAHSARVRRWKILLPVLALIISLGFIAVSWIRTILPENITISGATIENGKVVMEKPAISGRNGEGISYYMNARRALQDILNPNDITLEDIEAAVPVRGDLIARVKATTAHFDRATDKLDLETPFSVILSSGLVANFQSAHLDIAAGKLDTKDAISITAKGTSMVANSLKITDKGRLIVFEGKIRMTVDPAAVRTKAK